MYFELVNNDNISVRHVIEEVPDYSLCILMGVWLSALCLGCSDFVFIFLGRGLFIVVMFMLISI